MDMTLTEQSPSLHQVIEALEIGDELFWEPSRQAIPGAWTGHLAIAFWLIKAAQPSTFVELGTHSGNSYSAFCQAIAHFGMQARAFAVDTWRGDEHAGLYGEEVFEELHVFNESHFAGFSKLLRATFDEARSYFPESSIDLLHIDGLHTYDAVKRDFDNWKSALSTSAVVVFHDTNVRERDFGVWKLWQELAQIYPSFEFHHSEGLGILGFGQRQTRLMQRLFEMEDGSQSAATLRRIFASRGETFRSRSQVLDLAGRLASVSNDLQQQSRCMSALEAELAARDATLRDSDQQIQSNAEEISNLERRLVSRDATLADREQEIRTKAELIGNLQQELVDRDASLQNRDEEIRRASASIEQLQLTIASKDKILGARQRKIAELDESAAKLRAQLEGATKSLDEERSTASKRIEQLQLELASVRQKLGLIERSTAWEIVSRLRSAFQPYPKFRLYFRRLARVLWWTVSFQLIGRLRARRRLFQRRDMLATSTLFDEAWYLSQYPDLAEAGCDPALHYALYGATERRNPGPRFDAEAYLQRYPDVAELGANPLLHYLEQGASEGRIITPVDNPPDATEVLAEITQHDYTPEGASPDATQVRAEPPKRDYQSWVSSYDTLQDDDRAAIRSHIQLLRDRPLISIIMPVYNTNPIFLRKAIDSMLAQLYPFWELCIADDASSNSEIRTILSEYSRRDQRIKVVFRSENGHISAASNSALELATGEFIALSDHDDELSPHAIYMLAVELNEHPDADIVYSDEDKIDANGRRHEPHFKPDWNQELFYSYNMINHLGMYRTCLVQKIGGFREGFEGSQDYDLVLRLLAHTTQTRIRHIPHILYHWRLGYGVQTFSTDRLTEAVKSARRALAEHFASRSEMVQIADANPPCFNRIKRPLPNPSPRVSLIVPTRDKVILLRNCVDGLLHNTRYSNLEIIIVDNDSCEAGTLEYLDSLRAEDRVRILRIQGPFNHSAFNNMAAAQAGGELIGFINNDIEVIEPGWLEEMVSQAVQPGVGAVGAKLYYHDDTIQHAGVILGIGGTAGHSHRHFPRDDYGYVYRLQLIQNLSCVTAACMIMSKDVFIEVGGFDEVNLKASYNDVDLCIRIRQAGYSIVWTPYAELYHLEAASRGYDHEPENVERASREVAFLQKQWGDVLAADPCYNPNLTLTDESFAFALPPRALKPWRRLADELASMEQSNPPTRSTGDATSPAELWKPLWTGEHVPRSSDFLDSSRIPVKAIAFYLPQFHPIPENDRWWGKNFTEWRNVTRAAPRFAGHYQPHLPGDQGFYDLRVAEVLAEQTEVAKQYGISAFCFHYYWFGGKRLLERPLEQFLSNTSLDIGICICWANENWTRRWDGLESEVLIAQQYSAEYDKALINSLLPSFRNPRYVRVHGRPLFLVYRLDLLPDPVKTVATWRESAKAGGISDLFVAAVLSFDIRDVEQYGVDAGVEFPPHQTSPVRISDPRIIVNDSFSGGAVYDYAEIAHRFGKRTWNTGRIFKGVMPGWDNTARRGGQSTVFHGSTPAIYAGWLKDACDVTNQYPKEEKLLFLNAWNEWGEGAHLESDARYGHAYLEATANVLRNYCKDNSVERLVANNNARFGRKRDVALVLHCYHEDLVYDIVGRYVSNYSKTIDVFATIRPDVSLECLQYLEENLDNVLLLREDNRGRDIRPFLVILKKVTALGYRLACKIHTKRSPQLENGDQWRSSLINPLLGGRRAIALAEQRFLDCPDLGLLVPPGSLIDLGVEEINAGNRVWLDRLLPKMGRSDLIGSYRTRFPAGSMYWFRVETLAGLDDLVLEEDAFEFEVGQLDGTLAHAIERLVVLYASMRGYRVEEFNSVDARVGSLAWFRQ
jgi:lipopolysaccharide biosynthesis protein/GT2 family glycosyltransferase